MNVTTPWGQADHATVLADGIISYSTPSHGGIWLSAKRRKAIAKAIAGVASHNWLKSLEWWEEDVDWSVPYWYFRDDIRAFVTGWESEHLEETLVAAQTTIRNCHKECAHQLLSSPAVLATSNFHQLRELDGFAGMDGGD